MTTPDPQLLNASLHLAMEWGPNWLQPVQSRLQAQFPHLSPAELDNCNTLAQEAMRFGHAKVLDLLGQYKPDDMRQPFADLMRSHYPWIDEANCGHLFSQGMYYSMK